MMRMPGPFSFFHCPVEHDRRQSCSEKKKKGIEPAGPLLHDGIHGRRRDGLQDPFLGSILFPRGLSPVS